MSRNKKILIGVGVVRRARRDRVRQLQVQAHRGRRRQHRGDPEAAPRGDRLRVGQDPAEARVNISADTMGRVTDLAVDEGDRVTKGQFLLQIDPRNLRTRGAADGGVARGGRSQVEQLRISIETRQGRAEAGAGQLQPPAEPLEGRPDDARDARARGERPAGCARRTCARRSRTCGRSSSASSQRARRLAERPVRPEQGPHRIADQRHRHPPQHRGRGNGRHRHDEQRRHGAADDRRHVGHRGGSRGRRDRHPERAARAAGQGHDRRDAGQDLHRQGDRDRQQPDPGGTGQARRRRRPTSRSCVTLDGEIPEVRPGFTCTAEITTAIRDNVVAVPIQATTVREMVVDDKGNVVRPPQDEKRPRRPSATAAQAAELKPGQSRKELEGVFVVQDNKAVFAPVKTGIAGEKYFEVLSGLKEGDAVITGPFARCASSPTGRPSRQPRPRPRQPAKKPNAVNQFLEAAVIALGAIWANKLRSFLTVLGNIVAVTSIIAVVSLVQGMNGYVTTAIVSGVGADNFTIQRMPVVRIGSRRGTRPQQSRGSRSTKRRRSASTATNIGAVAAQAQSRATMAYGNETLDGAQVQGVSRDYVTFGTFNAERGRLISPAEIDAQPPGHGPRLGSRRQAVRAGRSDRQVDQDRQPAFPRRRRQREEGIGLRQLAGRLRDHPARHLPQDVRVADVRDAAAGQAEDPRAREGGHGRCDGGDAHRAAAAPERAGQLRDVHVGHVARPLQHGHQRDLRRADRRRRAVAGRRRHRHHEHHADGGQRADARDRPAQGARRAPARHRLADPDRVGHAVDLRRHGRHLARLRAGARSSASSRRCRPRSSSGRW